MEAVLDEGKPKNEVGETSVANRKIDDGRMRNYCTILPETTIQRPDPAAAAS